MPVTNSADKIVKVPCIYYLIYFQEGHEHVKALLNNGNKINAMNPVYVKKLSFKFLKTNIKA